MGVGCGEGQQPGAFPGDRGGLSTGEPPERLDPQERGTASRIRLRALVAAAPGRAGGGERGRPPVLCAPDPANHA